MSDLISDNSQPQLRKVTLAGDAKRHPEQKTQRDAQFFWVLSATAPYFGRQHTLDKFNKPSGVNADHVYPLRVLAADPPRVGNAGGPPWRRPRLIDLHLLVGATNDAYAEHEDDVDRVDRLILSFSKTSRVEVRARKGALLQTFPEEDEPLAAGVGPKAPFVRTVAEPLAVDDDQWPQFSDASEVIPVPPLRLVAGRVGLRVALVDANGHTTSELAWLRKLGIQSKKEGKADWARIWLMPDGIEFDAVFDAFPGSSGQKLPGRVRLSTDDDGKFYLNLLSAAVGFEEQWRNAWTRITPAVRDNREDDLLGLKFAALHDGSIPGVRWPVKMQSGIPGGLDPMQIPQRALRVELVSPSENGDIDGVASLATGWVVAAEDGDKVTFKFGSEPTATAPSALKISCLPKSIEANFGVIDPLGVHVDQLAADLRAAYGLQEPPVVPSVDNGTAAGPAFARPLLPAFVPLADGWLQLPVPNLGPRDTTQDIKLTVTPRQEHKTSMFGDGFFRLKRLGLPAGVLTVGSQFGSGSQAPWAVTIAEPTALHGIVEILPGKDPDLLAGVPAAGLLAKAAISVDGFSLSTRGLVWMSADRPDAFEALPRLGAGPGSFIDLAFESGSTDLIQVSVSGLTIKATRNDDQKSKSDPMEVEGVDLAIDFNVKGDRWIGELLRPKEARAALRAAVAVVDGKDAAEAVERSFDTGNETLPWSPVVWRRHHAIPLAAAMPMTRAAAGAVRPLESRDLIPFVLETKAAAPNWRRLAKLRISSGNPFAGLSDAGLHYKLASSWPKEPGDDANGNPDRGIAFAALGLPGVELRPIPDSSPHNAIPYQASLRFDLPALDEAFATAPLPPQPGGPASNEEREMQPPKPVATALDWPLLAELWGDQERKHQNSRVADSYMMSFKPVDPEAAQSKVDVKTLVKGLSWGGVSIQVGTKPIAGKLPYGSLSIDGGEALSGNDVLKGLEGDFTPNLETKQLLKNGGPPKVLGFSPGTFKSESGHGGADDYFDLDNRLTGIKLPAANPVGVLSRPVMLPDKKNLRQVSLLAPVAVKITVPGQEVPQQKFLFWFKDVLFENDGAVIGAKDGSIAFDVWNDAEKLAGAGFEWRLVPSLATDAEAAFRLGRNQMPFFGFRLEPLRLTALWLKNDKVEKASILCRLTLGEPERSPDPALNLVKLNLTLNLDGETLDASFENTPEESPLRFSFVVADAPDMGRRVAVECRIASDDGLASLSDLKVSRFAIVIADVDVAFSTAKISFALRTGEIGVETVSFTADRANQPIPPGAGRLRIAHAELTAGLELRADPARLLSNDPNLELKYAIEIVPRAESMTSATGMLSFERTYAGGSLSIFGWQASLPKGAIREGDGALVLAVTAEPIVDTAWHASLGLVARLKKAVTDPNAPDQEQAKAAIEGTAELLFGHCEADLAPAAGDATIVLGTGIEAKNASLRFTLSNAGTRDSDFWKGTATVSGTVTAKNSINWPSIAWKSPATIPLPGEPKENNGRVTVTPGQAADATAHTISWIFSDHRLDLALAASLAGKSNTALWTTLVTARHELSRGDKTLKWAGVETIAVGYPAAMIPKIPADLSKDSTTFAARYKGQIKNSEYVVTKEPGMHRPGLGAVATVLQGALGTAFRTAFWKHPSEGLMVMGGFLGVLRSGAATAAPLLRLPVLAGLGAGKIGQTVPALGIELSWTDGPAARLLALGRLGAPSPADTTLDALRAAALAGSLPLPPSRDGESWDDPAGAILVEQSFLNDDLAGATLETTPFFLASAVAVERMFGQPSLPGQMESLSLVAAASILRKKGKFSGSLSIAAALALRDKDLSPSPMKLLPRFALLGERLFVSDWTGLFPSESDTTWIPTLNGLAVARDSNPRAAFVAMSPAADTVTAQYFPYAFPPAILDEPPIPATPDASFADHGRGPVADPADEEPLRWLAPVVEGAGKPIRDYDDGKDMGSGLAGLTRRARLPAHTGAALNLMDENANDDFVWLSQTQVPIYLPLQTTNLKGPPIGWLTPATPLARLPASADVLQAMRASSGDDGAAPAGRSREVQPFLPQELSAASVGERAGIMTARRVRLLSGLATIAMFDPMYSRFGRPAQGGSSLARQLRTPRPARLPANTGNALKDRRIEASSVDPMTPFATVIGSADIVEGVRVGGEHGYGAWSISVIAAPEWESTVADIWDGTVSLVCRMFVVSNAAPTPAPRDLLGQALIDGTAGKLETRGILRIGNAAIPFSHASFGTVNGWTEYPMAPKKTFYADVEVILILKGSTRRVANSDIAAAFSAPGPLPAVEVQWTVHPSSLREASLVKDGELPLTIANPAQPELARGADRAPITLRMPLYPVTAIRGALPLTPATMLFADPAYDRDLAGPPAGDGRRLELTEDARKRLPAGRGDLKLVLTADRGQLHRLGTVTFMLDVRFDRPMDDIAQAIAEKAKAVPGGDLTRDQNEAVATMRLELQPKSGPSRSLRFGKDKVELKLGDVYELPLSAVTEADGAPARLSAGDILVMETALKDSAATAVLWHSASGKETDLIDLLPEPPTDSKAPKNIPSCSLRFVLTDDPVIEPPPALYAALLRTGSGASSRLSVPLHAQSPLPWRVDLADPARDFRHGLMRRHATFVWTLVRPRADFTNECIYVIKADRNGQTYLPERESEFFKPRG